MINTRTRRTVRQSGAGVHHTRTVAVALATLLAIASGGCGCPELPVYREGMNAVNEPLYEAHLLLMDDAVAAGFRSDADRRTVQAGISAARALYAESKRSEPMDRSH